MIEYPCESCIVKLQCVDPCIRLELNKDIIFKLLKHYKRCPDCGWNMFNKFYSGKTLTIKCLGCNREFISGALIDVRGIRAGNKEFTKKMITLERCPYHNFEVNAKQYYGTEVVDEIITKFKHI